ncbi:MAG TPA: hypothetical protein VEO54_24625 [Thermoanaerobaculia bacterium]|nr:hypothetical protein [Thermoanaerobaculia bacterium]
MRRVFTRKRHRRALFALVVMLLGGSAFADELFNDPEAKIRPPGGVQASQQEPNIPAADGVDSPETIRAMLPDGIATLFDAFRIWLSLQHILLPIG